MQGLVGGLLILALLLLIFGGTTRIGFGSFFRGGSFGSTGWFYVPGEQPELVAADFATSTPVGAVVVETVLENDLGTFSVYGTPSAQRFSGGDVSNGLLFGEQSLKYTVNDLESITVRIDNTNGYGAFVVKINGEIAFAELLNAGEHVLPIRVAGPVHIELAADSSYWKLWAPALYQISEVKLKSSESFEAYEFNGDSIVRGELVLNIDDSNDAGDLMVTVNGQNVYDGRADGAVSIDFSNVRAGKNKLTIMAAPGAVYSGSAQLNLVHAERVVKSASIQFNLTKAQSEKLPGHITFEIPAVMRQGRVSVKIIAGDQVKLAESFSAEVGSQAVAMFPANVVPGEMHTVLIEGAEGSAFTIRNLKVRV